MKEIIVFKTAMGQYGSILNTEENLTLVDNIANDGGEIIGFYPLWEDAC